MSTVAFIMVLKWAKQVPCWLHSYFPQSPSLTPPLLENCNCHTTQPVSPALSDLSFLLAVITVYHHVHLLSPCLENSLMVHMSPGMPKTLKGRNQKILFEWKIQHCSVVLSIIWGVMSIYVIFFFFKEWKSRFNRPWQSFFHYCSVMLCFQLKVWYCLMGFIFAFCSLGT